MTEVTPFSLKDAPALIEKLLPVQKLSAEAYKEQMAVHGKTLTALGSYWKGRKPLILAKACVLGCLLPATDNAARDLEIFEKLMAMDAESFVVRWKRKFRPKDVLATLAISRIRDYFVVTDPEQVLPDASPIDWTDPAYKKVRVKWRDDLTALEQRRLLTQMLPPGTYREWVETCKRPEEVMDTVHDHIWTAVNNHLGTDAYSFPELVEQLGIMRFGHRPKVADTFCGSGQIPFEAARLGCDVYASDLNPVACMLTWGAFNIVGGSEESRAQLAKDQRQLVKSVREGIDRLGIETDGKGWRAKVFLYCVETRCPQSGWMVPLLPSLIVSKGYRVVAELVSDPVNQRYDIEIHCNVSDEELETAKNGTVGREGKYGEAYILHHVDGVSYKTKISTLRGDYRTPEGETVNTLRQWEKHDFMPRPDDLLQERLYCVQWMRPKERGKGHDYAFRTVTHADLEREKIVQDYVTQHLADWQDKGWVPDMRIEVGGPPRYQGADLIKARGWRHWHHVFNPRQIMTASLINQFTGAKLKFGMAQVLNSNSRLSRWSSYDGGGGAVKQTFDNQALNTLFNYGTRASSYALDLIKLKIKTFPLKIDVSVETKSHTASETQANSAILITDPPYGDAVKYEEIIDFFIAWFRRHPPPEFADWVWDSRRALAIQGEDEHFRRNMVAAYKQMTTCMPDNGIQVIMFTHQSGAIWADMANIVWAAGLQVTAAWYVVTETDSALRDGSHVKGTVLLVCRKRQGQLKTTRDELAWDLQDAVKDQVDELTGLNQQAKGLYRSENLFEDQDIQMAGYAAALKVLTAYAIIDGRTMAEEAIRPRVKGEVTFVDELIGFAVDTANEYLVPQGLERRYWEQLGGAERFYLKMLDMERRGLKKLDNYQNFAKAFKVGDFKLLMKDAKANKARLKTSVELGRTEMGEGSELYQTVLRAVLYAMMELAKDVDSDEVVAHLSLNIPNYYGDMSQRELAIALSAYIAQQRLDIHPDEARAARVLSELLQTQRLG